MAVRQPVPVKGGQGAEERDQALELIPNASWLSIFSIRSSESTTSSPACTVAYSIEKGVIGGNVLKDE